MGEDVVDRRLRERLKAIGVETATERRVKRVTPWLMSLLLHGALIAVGFLVTWTVVLLKDEPDPPLIVADFDRLTFEPLAPLAPEDLSLEPEAPEEVMEPAPLERTLEDQLRELELDPVAVVSDAASPSSDAFTPPTPHGSVSFVGLSSSNARRIVYVIDASGSMVASLQIVLDELARSLDELTSQQSFGIIFFQRNEAVTVPPENRLTTARSDEKLRALAWIRDNVVPSGRSNPLQAIEAALRLDPDVVFLLSENITGSGRFEIDQADLLALLDKLNPVDPKRGRRRTQINCIQFLDPDPLDTLRRIAEVHGGPRAYKFLDRRELGIVAP